MIENTLLTIGIIAAGFAAFQVLRWYQVLRANRRIAAQDTLLQSVEPGRATILYFTATWCSACKLHQQPALQDLESELGDRVQIIQVDIETQPDDAKRWGVMSLPTTYILNADGEAKAVNYGVASAQKLKQQLEG